MKKRLLAACLALAMCMSIPEYIFADEINTTDITENITTVSEPTDDGAEDGVENTDGLVVGEITEPEDSVDIAKPVKPAPPEITAGEIGFDRVTFELILDPISKKYKLFYGEKETGLKLFATINMLALRGEKKPTKKNPLIKLESNFSYEFEYELTENDTLKLTIAGLSLKKTLYLSAKEYNTWGKKSKKSDVVMATTDLPSPVNVTASMKEYGYTDVVWDEVDGADSYFVFRSETADGTYKKIAAVTSAKYTDDLNGQDIFYYYKVRAKRKKKKNKYYNSEYSDFCCTQYEKRAPLEFQIADVTAEGVKLTWAPVPGAHTYSVYRSTEESSGYSILGTVVDACAYVDSDMLSGQTYYYKVASVYTDEFGDTKGYLSVAVDYSTDSIILNVTKVYMSLGQNVTLSYVTEIEGECHWMSSNEDVATVDENGVITALSEGQASVAVEIDGIRSEALVTVKNCSMIGIDVSRWQGNVNWDKVKQAGVQFVMMRAAYGTNKDVRFDSYYKNASEAGLPVGVYCYSIALPDENYTAEEAARLEAEELIKILDGRKLQLPVALDFEYDKQIKLTMDERTAMIKAYKEVIESAGYDFILYANLNWLKNYVSDQIIKDENINIWIARYRDTSLGHGYEGSGNIGMWQYSDKGIFDGIIDDRGKHIDVDMDISYIRFGDNESAGNELPEPEPNIEPVPGTETSPLPENII